ncbi:MAG TPA: HprK-related kinase A [Candidatus Binatia bacterium]|nr:HprK-related kinase A [Candidatus Binatia bacterium]
MTVGELARDEFLARLEHPGISLDTGPFLIRIKTAIGELADEVRFLYGEFPVLPDGGITHFRLELRRPAGLRRWWRPQVFSLFDGERRFEPMPLALAIPTLEWSLNWCVAANAHHHVMVHSAVLERDGRALLLPGTPGAGKSTLCAALAHRGWRLLSDEFALLRPADSQLVSWPRPISLKGPSIDLIRAFAPDARLGRTIPGTPKGPVAHLRPPSASVQRARDRAEPAWVVFPTYRAGEPARLTPLSRARAFYRLAQFSFNYELLGPPGFETLSRAIDGCDTYDFTYSKLDDALPLFQALVAPSSRRVAGS